VCVSARRPWLLAVAGALALAAALWQRTGLVATALAGHNGSGEVRTLVWLAAWHMIRDHPLFGIGLDQFLYYYSNLYTGHPYWITVLNGHPTLAWREPDLAHPHNLVLDLWLSVGLLGLLAFAAVLALFWVRCVRLWLRATRAGSMPSSGWLAAIALGLGASMLGAVLHGMVDSAYFVPDLALIFWGSVGIALAAEHLSARS
jgi:putative inorganic carbon (HCO3(-)) transporter